MITHTCKSCGVQFTKRNNPNRLYSYCSHACRGAGMERARLAATCGHCCDEFTIWPYELEQGRKYCSRTCADRAQDFGKTSEAFRLRTSAEYATWREAVFRRDDYTCQRCRKRGGKLNADHIKRFADHPDLRLSVDNGRTLCVPCHLKTPTFGNRRAVGAEA